MLVHFLLAQSTAVNLGNQRTFSKSTVVLLEYPSVGCSGSIFSGMQGDVSVCSFKVVCY